MNRRRREEEKLAALGLVLFQQAFAGYKYLIFNGSSTKVNCQSGTSLDNLHDLAFTFECWVNFDDFTAGRYLVGKNLSGSGWRIELTTTVLRAVIVCATSSGVNDYTISGLLTAGQWHHIAMTWNDATFTRPLVFVDGVQGTPSAGQNRSGAIVADAAYDLFFGCNNGAASFLKGKMGWVRLSNNVRYTVNFTPPERLTIPSLDGNTISLWPVNDGGSVANDLGTNNNDGTITDGAWGY